MSPSLFLSNSILCCILFQQNVGVHDLFTASSLKHLVKHYFYSNIVETIEHIFIYSLIRQAFNKHLFHLILEVGTQR